MNRQLISLQKQSKTKKIAEATEQALKVINSYQNRTSIFPSFLPLNQTYHNQQAYIKEISFGQIVRIQLLQNSEDFFRVNIKNQFSQSQIIIKNIRGQKMIISFDFNKNIYPSAQKCHNSYIINKQTIIPVSIDDSNKKQWLNIGVKSLSYFLLFSLRVDKISKINTLRFNPIQRQRSLKSEVYQLQQSNINFSTIKKSQKNKKWSSQAKLPNPKTLVRQYSPKNKEIRLKDQRQKYFQKHKQTLEKKQKVHIYKQKVKQYQEQATKCLRIIQNYEKKQKQNSKIKQTIAKMLSSLIYEIKFTCNVNQIYQIKKIEVQNALKLTTHIQIFVNHMRKVYINNARMIGNKKARTLTSVQYMTTLTAKISNITAIKNSNKIVCEVIGKLHAGLKLNQAFQYANNYRRSIRHIQKYWMSIFKARTQILLYYGHKMSSKFVKTNQKLKIGQQKMKETSKINELCIKYQKQQSTQTWKYFQEYKQKIQEKKDILRKNEEIRAFNKTCLQKYIKKQLEVPQDGALPQFRFFRNVSIFKAMIKLQLQATARRCNRQMKKLRESEELARKQSQQKKQEQQKIQKEKHHLQKSIDNTKQQTLKDKKSNSKSKIVINILKL